MTQKFGLFFCLFYNKDLGVVCNNFKKQSKSTYKIKMDVNYECNILKPEFHIKEIF